MHEAWICVAGLTASLATMPPVMRALDRFEHVDVPNHRSSHSKPVPRGGGVGVVIAALVALIFGRWSAALAGIVVGALIVATIGFLDDRRGLSPKSRLVAQAAGACVAVPLLLSGTAGGGPWLIALSIVSIVILVGYLNSFNFMDGINGISGLHACVGGITFALIGRRVGEDAAVYAGLALAGASGGFLPFNIVKPRVFLGDVGSYFMGFWLAGSFVVVVSAGAPLEVALGPLLYYLADTSSTVVRRWRRGDRLTEAHRDHSYQRLVQGGWSHLRTALVTTSVTAACSLLMYSAISAPVLTRVSAFVAAAALAAAMTALPFVLRRSSPGTA